MKNSIVIKIIISLLALFLSTSSYGAMIYLAEIDAAQSSGYIEGANPYQISGAIQITVDINSIQFSNVNLSTSPLDVSNELIIPAIGSYDGLNFEYREYPPELPILGNWYAGTFDGSTLFMQATTYNGTLYDFTINTLSVTPVPLPSALLLFSSGIFGLFLQLKRKASNKSLKQTD